MRTRHDPVSTPIEQAPGRVLLTGATGDILEPESLAHEVTPANELREGGRPELHPNSPLELVAPGRSVGGKAALRSPS